LSIVALKQIDLINNKPLGFEKEHTLVLANPYMLGSSDNIIALKTELMAAPGIEQVSVTGYTPSQRRWGSHLMTFPGNDAQDAYRQVANWIMVDESFVETMGLELTAGRNFLTDHLADKYSVIINETAVSAFGLANHGRNA